MGYGVYIDVCGKQHMTEGREARGVIIKMHLTEELLLSETGAARRWCSLTLVPLATPCSHGPLPRPASLLEWQTKLWFKAFYHRVATLQNEEKKKWILFARRCRLCCVGKEIVRFWMWGFLDELYNRCWFILVMTLELWVIIGIMVLFICLFVSTMFCSSSSYFLLGIIPFFCLFFRSVSRWSFDRR